LPPHKSSIFGCEVLNSQFFLVFWLTILISGCFSPHACSYFSSAERARYEDFFRRLLFLEQGVYTLYGSKPMTEIILSPVSPEERLLLQERAFQQLSLKERSTLLASSFEYEEKYWFEETWSMWEEKLKTLPMHRYLFVERTIGIPSDQRDRYIYFVNILETAKVIRQHYPLFKEYVGFDFDPLAVVFEMKNPTSLFWTAIWGREVTDRSVCLMGILFGYGFENSYPFSWHFTQGKNPEEIRFIQATLNRKTPVTTAGELRQFNPPQKFPLPCYISFSDDDPHKEKYRQECAKIRQIYMQSDILSCTMQQLLK
jgi:hypothetical protein